MPALNKFNSFPLALGNKVHNLGADTLKIALSNTAPAATNTTLANITQIAASGGYVAGAGGGYALDSKTWTESGGVSKLQAADEVITASGGSIGPFRYIVLYNDTATNDELIGWYDYGSSITLAAGETLTVDFDGTNGILTVG